MNSKEYKTTSREALIVLKCLAIGSERELMRLALIIKKDLDVLEILKNKNIEMELLKSCVKLPDGIIRYNKIWAVSDNSMIVYKDKYLEYEEFNKLKEWLENEPTND